MTTMNLPKTEARNTRTLGFTLAIAGAVLMSIDPIFIRYAGVSGFDTAFLFGLFSAISMPILLKFNDKRGIRKAVAQSGGHCWQRVFLCSAAPQAWCSASR